MKIDIRLLEKRMRLHGEAVSGIYAKEFGGFRWKDVGKLSGISEDLFSVRYWIYLELS